MPFIEHKDIVNFAEARVNLKRDDAKRYREQVWNLREALDRHLKANPDFALRKLMLSGSLAKGTALKSLNDADVACYVESQSAPQDEYALIVWLADKLQSAFPNITPDQVTPNQHSVTIEFRGTGLKIDVVPIFYDGDPDWRGYLLNQDGDERVLTSIPMHLKFVRKRKEDNPQHFAQIVRLVKYWAKKQKAANPTFRCKSFMVELIVAHLADRGAVINHYPEAMAKVFNYVVTDQFNTSIAFSDFYDASKCQPNSDPIRIWDPVNSSNNVAKLYTPSQRTALLEASMEAADAIDGAIRAPTKGRAVEYWRKVLGSTFSA